MNFIRRQDQEPERSLSPQLFTQRPVEMTQGELLVTLTSYGLTRKDIADILGVTTVWLDTVVSRDAGLQDAIKQARNRADMMVVNALFRRACGYNYREVIYDKYGKEVKKIYKHLPPDVTACIFWLKNRMKDEWTDTYRAEFTVKDRMELGNRELSK